MRETVIEIKQPERISANRFLSETLLFPTSKKVIESEKTVFNYVPCDNEFELAFAKFLAKAEDVSAFAKLPEQFGFSIQYTDTRANIRNYFPDFIAISEDGTRWVLETKGREDVDVRLKDNAAVSWCQNASELTEENWSYIKVGQKDFESLHPDSLEEMVAAIVPPRLFE